MHDKSDNCLRCQMVKLINDYFKNEERVATVEESRYILSCIASVSGEALAHSGELDLAVFYYQVGQYRDMIRAQDGISATKQ